MKFTRLFAIIGACVVGFSSFSGLVSARQFYDVANNHKNHDSITHLTNLNIVNGYSDGSFRPYNTISRAEATKLLMASVKTDSLIQSMQSSLYQNIRSVIPFYDVQASDWFAPYVALAYRQGVIKGYPDGSFSPNNTLNFAEGLKIILEAYGVDTRRVRFQAHDLLYVQASDWFARYFGYAYNKNLIDRNKFYHPSQPMTRGDFVEILYRIKSIKESGLESYITNRVVDSNEYTITIPSLNLINVNVSFADPYDAQESLDVLKNGLGHYLSPPGGGKKMVLFGHSSGYSWDHSSFKQVLRQIDRLQDGDLIYVNYREKGYAYRVGSREIVPAPQLTKVMEDYGYEEMALYTCWPPNSTSYRYVIYAAKI